MDTLKAILSTVVLVIIVGACIGVIYFLSIFGGVALLSFLTYMGISEYRRELKELKQQQEEKDLN